MPAAAPVVVFIRLLDNLDDLRVTRHTLCQRMHVESAKALGEVLVLFGRDLLVAEEQHEMIEEGVVDL